MAHIGSNLQRKSDFINGYQNIEDDRAKSESDEDTPEQGPSRRQSLNEGSPLLSPQRVEDNENSFPDGTPPAPLECNEGGDQEESKSAFYLFILTLGIGG